MTPTSMTGSIRCARVRGRQDGAPLPGAPAGSTSTSLSPPRINARAAFSWMACCGATRRTVHRRRRGPNSRSPTSCRPGTLGTRLASAQRDPTAAGTKIARLDVTPTWQLGDEAGIHSRSPVLRAVATGNTETRQN